VRAKKKRISRARARAWLRGHRIVHLAGIEELRRTSIQEKLRQVAGLMNTAYDLGWRTGRWAEDRAVHARWQLLRKRLGG